VLLPTVRLTSRVQMINEPWAGGGDVSLPAVIPPEILPPLDSDGDGWSDVDETHIHGTLPGNPNTDGDALDEGPDLDDDPAPLDPCDPDGSHPACVP
jgi:hypothetical protein